MENPVIIFGAGGLGAVALDIFKRNNVTVYCFLDDDDKLHNTEIDDISVMGATEDESFTSIIGTKCEAFVALGEFELRRNAIEMLQEVCNVMPINAIHDQSLVSTMASIGHGNLISAGVVINARAEVGNHCLIHSNAVIEYDVKMGDFVQIGAGSNIGAGVELEDNAFVGAGATVVAGVKISKGARIGAGSVVVENVKVRETVFGNPAKKV